MKSQLLIHLTILCTAGLTLGSLGFFDELPFLNDDSASAKVQERKVTTEKIKEQSPNRSKPVDEKFADGGKRKQRQALDEAQRKPQPTNSSVAKFAAKISKNKAIALVQKDAADKKLNPQHVAVLLQAVGFPESSIPRMVCTAKYESAFKTNATNQNSNGSQDTGLFQINDLWEKECGVSRESLKDPVVNAACARKVFSAQGYWAWYAYRKNQDLCKKFQVGRKQLMIATK